MEHIPEDNTTNSSTYANLHVEVTPEPHASPKLSWKLLLSILIVIVTIVGAGMVLYSRF
ncbi:MAG: hypothetical protein R3B92_02695 [Patescibacteria group bacterium]|uniref:Uncharacterized protein n=1 Tax=candidate division WWE3 bacterium TaxID=2053526 RepID=A0A955ECG4_UNCKA|nr:hypothetical protein [candidate division WWE3 bacterium]